MYFSYSRFWNFLICAFSKFGVRKHDKDKYVCSKIKFEERRIMNYRNINNCTQRQFDAVMKRECISVSDYYDKPITYDVFFRKNNRGTNPQGKVRIFYSQSTPINIGTVFVLKDIPYVVISRDGDEGEVYYTSMAVKCDTSLTTYVSGEGYITVPFITISDKYTLQNGSTISLISGNANCYTGLNKYSQNIAINDTFYNYGGYYKVGNFFWNNGLCYIYMSREATPADSYTLTYDGETTIDMSTVSTYQLSYLALNNTSIVENPTLTYVSSNTDVVTVDDTGLVTFLASGSTTITATWVDGDNTTCSTVITVTNGEDNVEGGDTPTVTLAITGNKELKYGFSRTYKAVYSDADSNDVSANYTTVWTVTPNGFDASEIGVEEDGNSITLLVENEDLIDSTITLSAVDADGLFTPASIEITIIDIF